MNARRRFAVILVLILLLVATVAVSGLYTHRERYTTDCSAVNKILCMGRVQELHSTITKHSPARIKVGKVLSTNWDGTNCEVGYSTRDAKTNKPLRDATAVVEINADAKSRCKNVSYRFVR